VALKISHGNDSATFVKNLVNVGAVTMEFKKAVSVFLPRLGCNLTIILHSPQWRSETNWNVALSIAAVNQQ